MPESYWLLNSGVGKSRKGFFSDLKCARNLYRRFTNFIFRRYKFFTFLKVIDLAAQKSLASAPALPDLWIN